MSLREVKTGRKCKESFLWENKVTLMGNIMFPQQRFVVCFKVNNVVKIKNRFEVRQGVRLGY